ncbi:MAG: VWA domain-containing protein [Anaerolineales bacterium]
MYQEFFGDHLAPLAWGEMLPSVWDKPFQFSEQAWAGEVTEQPFIRSSAGNLSEDYQKIGEIMRDTFVGLHDRMARFQGRDEDLVSTEVFHHLSGSEEWTELQEKTRGDTMGSALATSHIAREFLSNLPDEVREALQEHQKAQKELDDAQAKASAGMKVPQEELDALKEQVSQTQQEALDAMGESPAQMTASAWASAQAAQEELKEAKQAADAFGFGWGNEAGPGGGMANLDGIVALAEQIKTHEGLQGLLDALGWVEAMAESVREDVSSGLHYFTHYERGPLDLERLADQEIIGLASDVEEIRLSFFARAIDGDVLLKHYEGEDELGKGPFVFVYDTSGSIKPYRSILAAVTLALMKAAREEERRFVAIPFSGDGEFRVFDLGPDPTPGQLLDLIQFGYWGGTEPYAPLEEALEIIRDDDSLQKADVLFLTDGKFREPPEPFLRELERVREDVGVSLVSLLLFASNPHCEQFSDRVVSAMRLDDRGSLRMAFEEVFRRW